MTKPRFPIEVPFRLFVAMTFAGTITFHILGLGLHTYIGRQKNALVTKIERLAEIRSQLLGIEAGLAVFRDRLTSVTEDSTHLTAVSSRRLFPQIRVITFLLRDLSQSGSREAGGLTQSWREASDFFSRCPSGVLPIRLCLGQSSVRFAAFGEFLASTRQEVSRHLLRVERWQSRLEHWDTVLYWLTTVLGLLFMALGWRNVVLQVGSPIEDVTRYLETLQEKAPESSSLPALFSIRELRILKESMRGAHKDSLTGLLTRQAFATILKREWEGDGWCEKALAVALFDIDHLRMTNESAGMAGGDEILRQVAGIIREEVHPGDIVGRWGDDEFIVLSYGLTEQELKEFMEKIREKVAGIRFEESGGRAVRVSGGGGLKGDEDDWTSLVRKVEESLSQAKVAGGDRAVLRSEVES